MPMAAPFKLTLLQRIHDRKRAERALGRPLTRWQQVHHHSPTQLVICEDVAYHHLLHARWHEYLLSTDKTHRSEHEAKLLRQIRELLEETEAIETVLKSLNP